MPTREEEQAMCVSCGGDCCKRIGGAALPHQFPSLEAVIQALRSKMWVADWEWAGRPLDGEHSLYTKAYFLRPAPAGEWPGYQHHTEEGEGCCLWEEGKGCIVSFEARPDECQKLIPHRPKPCTETGKNSLDAAAEWFKTGRMHIAAALVMLEAEDGQALDV